MEDIVAALPRGGGLRGRAFAVAGAGRQVEAVLSWSEARRVETALRPSVRPFVTFFPLLQPRSHRGRFIGQRR